jgi:ferredoxin-NADP reductase
MNTIEQILDDILRREGGYVNHPADRGGPTNFGITAQTLGSWRKLGRPATAAEVQALTEPEARAIYRQQYITGPGFETITHPALLHLLVDAEDGRLDVQRICAAVPDWKHSGVWFCGPAAFGQALRREFLAQGLPAAAFHQELFDMR